MRSDPRTRGSPNTDEMDLEIEIEENAQGHSSSSPTRLQPSSFLPAAKPAPAPAEEEIDELDQLVSDQEDEREQPVLPSAHAPIGRDECALEERSVNTLRRLSRSDAVDDETDAKGAGEQATAALDAIQALNSVNLGRVGLTGNSPSFSPFEGASPIPSPRDTRHSVSPAPERFDHSQAPSALDWYPQQNGASQDWREARQSPAPVEHEADADDGPTEEERTRLDSVERQTQMRLKLERIFSEETAEAEGKEADSELPLPPAEAVPADSSSNPLLDIDFDMGDEDHGYSDLRQSPAKSVGEIQHTRPQAQVAATTGHASLDLLEQQWADMERRFETFSKPSASRLSAAAVRLTEQPSARAAASPPSAPRNAAGSRQELLPRSGEISLIAALDEEDMDRMLEMELEMQEERQGEQSNHRQPLRCSSPPRQANRRDEDAELAWLEAEAERQGMDDLDVDHNAGGKAGHHHAGASDKAKDMLPSKNFLPPDSPEPDLSRFDAPNRAVRHTTHFDDQLDDPRRARVGMQFKENDVGYRPEQFLEGNRDEAGLPKYIPAVGCTTTLLDGSMFRLRRRRRMKGWKLPPIRYGDGHSNLLSRPIHQLVDEVNEKIDRQGKDGSGEREGGEGDGSCLDDDDEDGTVSKKAKGKQKAAEPATPETRQLWVDRYQPRKFADLLGDERVHREVMGWLKQWDRCVFKKQPPTKRPRYKPNEEQREYYDAYDRPQEKILMLSGQPGLGKTTLAHVIAEQAGYAVYELNASDSRNAAAVEGQVKMALESASLKDKRPTLVVIDEIDGATGGGEAGGGGFIRALLKLVQSGVSTGGRGKGQKKKRSKPLLRPIICICNDLYAASLRPLRPMAKLVRLSRPATTLLVNRLRTVCEAEELNADTKSLTLLTELTAGDIRSCLNALQFAKTKSSDLTEADIRTAALGVKDGSSSAHNVWSLIFKLPNAKQRNRGGVPTNIEETVQMIVHEAQMCSEYDKRAQGCFELYPKLHRLKDDGWHRYEKAHEWLYFGQKIADSVYSLGTYELQGYSPWAFAPWHMLFAGSNNPTPDYPKADYEAYLKTTAYKDLSNSLHGSLPAETRNHFTLTSLATEFGPLLLRILTPSVKPVNSQVVRPDEKKMIDSLVRIMIHLGLRFVQDRTEEGHLVWKVDPPLDSFAQFEGQGPSASGPSTGGGNKFAIRHMVSKEIDAAMARLASGGTIEKDESNKFQASSKAIAIYKQKNDMVEEKKVEKIAVDFFGRPVIKKPTLAKAPAAALPLLPGSRAAKAAEAAAASQTPDATDNQTNVAAEKRAAEQDAKEAEPEAKRVKVYFRFQQGFSAAVWKPVKVSDLM